MWRKGETFVRLVGMQIGATTVESSMEIPQKLKMDLAFDTAIPLLEIYPKEPKTLIWKNISPPCIHCSFIYNHQDMEAAQVSISR